MVEKTLNFSRKIKQSITEVRKTCLEVENLLAKEIPSNEIINDTILSIEEALTNIIYYSNPEKSKKLIICLKICLKNNTIEVRLEDNGVPFDIKSVPAPDIKSNLAGKKKGGYGIFLITRLMNFVESKRIKNQNILTMRKHLIIP